MVARRRLEINVVAGLVISICIAGALAGCSKDNNKNNNTTPTTSPPDTLDCSGTIQKGGTLVNDPNKPVDYFVTCELTCRGDVTIEPGTVIMFDNDTRIKSYEQGSLSFNGTKDEPITLTSAMKSPGSWGGVMFDSDNPKNKMSYTNVEYAAGKNQSDAAVLIWADAVMTMDHCKISQSKTYGFEAISYNSDISISNSTFTGNEAPIFISGYLLDDIMGNNDFKGNTTDRVMIKGSSFKRNTTWHKINVPYLVTQGEVKNDDLTTIEAGTEIHMGQETRITVNDHGSIIASGSLSEPIIIKGEKEVAGYWEGIDVYKSSNPSNIISNMKIMHAGGNNRDGAIYLFADPFLNVSNVTFTDIPTCAIYSSVKNPKNLSVSNCNYNSCNGTVCHN